MDYRKHDAQQAPSLCLHDTPRQENEKRIYDLIILDESGSMDPIRNQAISGVNRTIDTIRTAQRQDPSFEHMLTLVTFSSGKDHPCVRSVINNRRINSVSDIMWDDYVPDGFTPLDDALGISIRDLASVVHGGDNVLVTVITDGCDTGSQHFTTPMVKEMVESMRTKGWVFTFIGAYHDSSAAAEKLGINNSMDFQPDAVGVRIMWDKLNSCRMEYYKKISMKQASGISEELEDDFFLEKRKGDRITPDNIEDLGPHEIVVLGCKGESGPHGNRYCIDTISENSIFIADQINLVVRCAGVHPEN